MIIYGIPACDTCRKARAALEGRAEWRDLRKTPLTPEEVDEVLATFGDRAINRSSTTWRQLDDETRTLSARELLLAHPTLLKRPLIRTDADLHIGWTAAVQEQVL